MFSPEAPPNNLSRVRNIENQINSTQSSTAFVLHKKLNNSTTNLNSNATINNESIPFLNGQTTGTKRELELTPNNMNGLLKSSNGIMARVSKHSKTDLYSPIANSTGINNTVDNRALANEKNTHSTPMEILSYNSNTTTNGNTHGSLNNENTLVDTPIATENVVKNIDAVNGSNLTNNLNHNGVQKIHNQENFLSQISDFIRAENQKVLWEIEDQQDRMMSENYKFKCEMFKEFMLLKQELNDSIKQHLINEALLSEVVRLKEENKRLKKLF